MWQGLLQSLLALSLLHYRRHVEIKSKNKAIGGQARIDKLDLKQLKVAHTEKNVAVCATTRMERLRCRTTSIHRTTTTASIECSRVLFAHIANQTRLATST